AQNCARNGSAACCGECHPSTKSVFWLGAFWNAAASVARRRFGSVETPLQSLGGTTGSQRRRRFAVPAHSMECEPPNYRNVQSPKWQQVLTTLHRSRFASRLLLALMVSGLALGFSGCSKRKDETVQADAPAAQPVVVKTALIEQRPVERYVEVVGSLKA